MSETFWTLERLAAALGGCADGALPTGAQRLLGVSTDTRSLERGAAFVALVGEHFDGHAFLADAVRAGAAAVVVSSPVPVASLGVPVFEVRDTLRALGALGEYRRRAWGGPVVAVAGSNGKTTTKELIRAALGARLDVHATAGNLNNLVGVPLTLLALRDEADVAIVELGMNVPGEMARLRAIAAADVAVVTSVGEEHLEGLGSMEGVLREESIAFDGARVAVTPAGQPELATVARGRAARVVEAGLDGGDFRADAWGLEPDGRGWICFDGVTVRPPLRGVHNLRNAMLALATAREFGVDLAEAAAGVAAMPVPAMRSAWQQVGRLTVINDAYNANPPSMRAALDLLDALDGDRQRVAVLGTMRELGTHAAVLHEEIARRALRSSVDVLAGVGEMADALAAAGRDDPRLVVAPDVDELWEALRSRLRDDAVVLLKASRGVKLERILPLLSAWATG